MPRDPRVDPARKTLAIALGNAQIPEVIIEIDHLSRFSWTLLGPPARSEQGARNQQMVVTRREGSTIVDADGTDYLDGMAGLWCVNIG